MQPWFEAWEQSVTTDGARGATMGAHKPENIYHLCCTAFNGAMMDTTTDSMNQKPY